MELEARLRAFAAFARHRSFSAAAQELRISQPAVSKHVADVEREIGTRLVDRHSRGGTLTSAGEFLANHVLRAQALLAQAAQTVEVVSVMAPGVPQALCLVAAALLGFLVGRFFGGQSIYALAIGGGSLLLAALLTLRVEDRDDAEASSTWHPGFPKSSV